MSDPKIDPEVRAESIQNIKHDTVQIADQLESWCKHGLPARHLVLMIQATLNNLLEPLAIVLSDDDPPGEGHELILPTWRELDTQWGETYDMLYSAAAQAVKNQKLKGCADKARSFAKMVQGL